MITAGLVDRAIDRWETEFGRSTIKNMVSALVLVPNEAVRDGIIAPNPANDESLNLDPAVRHKAQTRHHEIRQVLADAGLVVGSFLQGSFARRTMLKPLKDVDIVCILAERYRDQLMTAGGPRKALEMFRDAVAAHWPDAGFDEDDPPAGKALRVSFPDCDFHRRPGRRL